MKLRLGKSLLTWWAVAVIAVIGFHEVATRLNWVGEGIHTVAHLVTAALLILPYIIFRRHVLKPLSDIRETANKITAGNLTARSSVDSPVEFKELSDALNDTVDKLAVSHDQLRASNMTLMKAIEERTHELTVEHDKLSAIFRSIMEGVVFISISGEIVAVNPMFETVWGVKSGELTGKMVENLPEGPLKDSLMFRCAKPVRVRCWEMFNCLEKNCPAYMSDDVRCWLISGTYCRKGRQTDVKRKRVEVCSQCALYKEIMDCCSEVREIEIGGRQYKISTSLVLDDTNKVIGETKTFYDQTEEKMLERRKADFVALITHDLKSPLTSIIGYAELLSLNEASRMSEEGAKFVDALRGSGNRMLEMVEQYLDLTRVEAGVMELKKLPVLPEECIREVVMGFEPQVRAKGLSLSVDVMPGLGPIEVDKEKMHRVMANLLGNAVKYTPSGGAVTISCREVGNGSRWLEFAVSDNGPGISGDDLPYVFDRYYRSRRDLGAKGSGLGLAVVKSLVEAHGGTVSAESAPGSGSVFRVRIPLGAG